MTLDEMTGTKPDKHGRVWFDILRGVWQGTYGSNNEKKEN